MPSFQKRQNLWEQLSFILPSVAIMLSATIAVTLISQSSDSESVHLHEGNAKTTSWERTPTYRKFTAVNLTKVNDSLPKEIPDKIPWQGSDYELEDDPDPLANLSPYVIPCTEEDFDMITMFVMHEGDGTDPSYYYGCDIDLMQQCLAACAVNAVSHPGCPDNVRDVIICPGRFISDESELRPEDSENKQARENVRKVLTGQSIVPDDLLFEMGFVLRDENGEIIQDFSPYLNENGKLILTDEQFSYLQSQMEEQVGPVEIFYWTSTVTGRVCLFARKG